MLWVFITYRVAIQNYTLDTVYASQVFKVITPHTGAIYFMLTVKYGSDFSSKVTFFHIFIHI